MDLSGQASQARFASYVEALVEVIGHADRAEPLNDYLITRLRQLEFPLRTNTEHYDL